MSTPELAENQFPEQRTPPGKPMEEKTLQETVFKIAQEYKALTEVPFDTAVLPSYRMVRECVDILFQRNIPVGCIPAILEGGKSTRRIWVLIFPRPVGPLLAEMFDWNREAIEHGRTPDGPDPDEGSLANPLE